MSARPTNEISATNRAFLLLICALVWLVVAPVFFIRGFCAGNDPSRSKSDRDEINVHSGSFITGAERDHG